MLKPNLEKLPAHFRSYISEVIDENIIEFHKKQSKVAAEFFESIGEEKSKHRYAEGKWSIKQVIGHICDSERIFACRMLHFARGEKQKLPGFDENEYMSESNFDDFTLDDLIEQFKALRASNITLFDSFNEEMWNKKGIADNIEFSVSDILYISTGHTKHHLRIIKERYL